jgi:predicted transposase YdaD
MIQLTPLEETTAVKELLQIKETKAMIEGNKQGRKEGIEKGKLIGTIMTLQRVMKLTLTEREILMKQSIEQLQTMLAKLEAKFQ